MNFFINEIEENTYNSPMMFMDTPNLDNFYFSMNTPMNNNYTFDNRNSDLFDQSNIFMSPLLSDVQYSPKMNTIKPQVASTSKYQPYSLNKQIHKGIGQKMRRKGTMELSDNTPFFNDNVSHTKLWDNNGNELIAKLIPKVEKGFFLNGLEWTCYRRNYFQISSSLAMLSPLNLHEPRVDGSDLGCDVYIRDAENKLIKVEKLFIQIEAKTTGNEIEGPRPVTLIQHTTKRDKGPQSIPNSKEIRAGKFHNITGISGHKTLASFERLQFKSATANNGKRKSNQQYYTINMKLFAKVDGLNNHVLISSVETGYIVVRGRSPAHYEALESRMNNGVFNINDFQ